MPTRMYPEAVSSSGVDVAHGQPHAPLPIHLENLHAYHIAFFQFVADALDALFGDLRDVNQAVAARENGHEGAEVHQSRDLAFIHSAHFDVGGDEFDAALGFAARGTLYGSDLHRAVVLDIDRGAGFFGDLPDHCAALADHVADLLRIDLQSNDGGRPFRHAFARLGEHFVHLAQDVQAAVAGLIERHLHDLARDAGDLDIHLQRSDAVLHETHRDPGHRRLDRHAGVHQREAGAAHGGH